MPATPADRAKQALWDLHRAVSKGDAKGILDAGFVFSEWCVSRGEIQTSSLAKAEVNQFLADLAR